MNNHYHQLTTGWLKFWRFFSNPFGWWHWKNVKESSLIRLNKVNETTRWALLGTHGGKTSILYTWPHNWVYDCFFSPLQVEAFRPTYNWWQGASKQILVHSHHRSYPFFCVKNIAQKHVESQDDKMHCTHTGVIKWAPFWGGPNNAN